MENSSCLLVFYYHGTVFTRNTSEMTARVLQAVLPGLGHRMFEREGLYYFYHLKRFAGKCLNMYEKYWVNIIDVNYCYN